ncbi:relaxase/mobilization nuclease domain-containing protein [Nocardioides alkalitolerans]|uniref:relaxase/mobilization nuclease domain-containing protein n=1 Tax=Nocardioides alkalitolerans TaxID=281714 RepID=UPI001B7FC5E1|nr:relaxase/mobilization nuclease domain-containing protein [Nocardioides alkalitolerans]
MPNVTKGDRMAGLLVYLTGPGRSNEHTEPHLVAGDEALMMWHDDDSLGRDSALAIARHLERPRKAFGVDVAGGHVWHCSLSLAAREGQLSDETWGAIASDFVRAMGFDDNEGTKAACRWVAVHHGLSTNDNDHIHIAVNLVREDGTKATTHKDYSRVQAASRALEIKYDLETLESVQAERATRGYDPAEREAQARSRARARYDREHAGDTAAGTTGEQTGGPRWEDLTGDARAALVAAEMRTDEPRFLLALKVRGSASASRSEGEFVRRIRRDGLLVQARFAHGRTDVVTGYSVAERPQYGERPIWYGGGHLGRDLTLPRLRDGWEDTPTGASEAAAEWAAAKRGRRVVAPGRENVEPTPAQWAAQAERVEQLVERLRAVPVTDRDTWATVARQSAGALAAWSNATEAVPGELAAASEVLSRSAQTYRRTVRPQKAGTVALSGAAMLFASVAHGGRGPVAQAVMVRQMIRLTSGVMAAARAAQDHRQADVELAAARASLVAVHDRLSDATVAARPLEPLHPERRHDQQPGRRDRHDDRAVRRAAALEAVDPQVRAMFEVVNASQARPATEASTAPPVGPAAATSRRSGGPGRDAREHGEVER